MADHPFFHAVLHFINLALYVVLARFVVQFLYEAATWRMIPNARTAPGMRRRMIKLLKADYAAREPGTPYTIIDLGSGNGHLTSSIARAMPQAKVIGFEMRPAGIWRSNLRKRFLGPANVEYRQASFLEHDMAEANAVVMFLSAKMMETLRVKLQQDLQPGTLVLSNTFPLGGEWVPSETTKYWSLIYIDSALFVYRK